MTRTDVYGWREKTLDGAKAAVEAALGLQLERRNSSYRGGDYLFYSGNLGELVVQPNLDWDEPAEPSHPEFGMLLYVSGSNGAIAEVERRLAGVEDLYRLRSERA